MNDDAKRSPRNKTLQIHNEERELFAGQLFRPDKGSTFTAEQLAGQILCADLFDVLDLLPAAFADLIIVDPPYNLTKNFHGFSFRASEEGAYETYLRSWLPRLARLLKEEGSIYVCGDWRSTGAIQRVLGDYFHVCNRITWQREKGRGALHNWKNGMEDIWFAVKNKKDYYFDVESVKVRRKVLAPYKKDGKPKDWQQTPEGRYRDTHPSNFWDDLTVPYWSMPENTEHPTQKPEKLVAKLILASCPPDGLVFDPFLGSGTSAVVAKKLGRKYCGVEMNEEYCLWAQKRLYLAEQDTRIQGYTDGIFWERNSNPGS